MKRSSALRLSLLAATPLVLAGCDNPAITGKQAAQQDWAVVDCSTAELMRTEACRTELENLLAGSPRYGSQSQCENELGGTCAQINEDGGNVWVGPMTGFMTGYLLSEVIDEIGDAYKVKRRAGYRDYRGTRYPGNRGTYPSTRPDAAPPPTRAITQSRSGFGSTSSARSSFGG